MKTKDFEKKIKHLNQEQILTGSLSTLNKVLVEKEVITSEELQMGFLDWVKENGLGFTTNNKDKKRKK